uniref:Uncharacterized protein n=1 Tax=Mucochytrium quahogii TaxID=96639 RepID=A0A7S2WJF0_9STRA|mmetsp:Transcript_7586/g.12257  ORF Transcript_7586/g.12257 Transcript_7586/m.12257 type:complete len:578 (+) Transcript_7586:249-1982(+)|eukprot:CAMPEP_0203795722 /NCGR_PEP_ID=MMETSP0100_2-20121128/7421_1 /ASSEMBLY_ACC=CAM_ASM_000210 /TAXON_ID=96639 /ORGANISM=" , Strain NY0313808BC1" /LENGTH=577 /DNA_ID=CAMNT_0050700329 /DNA_START=153 /DNA_END=1886 /DNA_ORIENTATION=-
MSLPIVNNKFGSVSNLRIAPEQAIGVNQNVCKPQDLQDVPQQHLSGNPKRPLKLEDDSSNLYTYVLNPLLYCVWLILLVEAMERFAFYGINMTTQSFLTGFYNADWNAGMSSTEASSVIFESGAIAYAAPFIGAILADGFFGNYWTIILGCCILYIPGLAIIAATAYPFGISDTFPTSLTYAGFMFLYPIGAGVLKSCVNVLGAQQFHPIYQAKAIERFYVFFYVFINIGALLGGLIVPSLCQFNNMYVFYGYLLPVSLLSLALILFVLGTRRYVLMKPQGSVIMKSIQATGAATFRCPPSFNAVKISHGGKYEDSFISKMQMMGLVVVVMLFTVPFNIVYSQIATVFITQGNAMQKVGIVDGSWMSNFDSISVIFSGFLVSGVIYPTLDRFGIELHMMTKFGIGTFIGGVVCVACVIIDYQIHSHYNATGEPINVFWQIVPYMLLGFGEIFVISSAYEAAFILSPDGFKTFGSALNLLCVGCIPNLLSAVILNACEAWAMTDANGGTELNNLEEYSTAHVYRFLWVLAGISFAASLICILPPVKRMYDMVEKKSKMIEDQSAGRAEVGFESKPEAF